MSLNIRPCGPGDAERLSLVGQASFLETYAGHLDAEDILHHCRVEHGAERYAAWLADPVFRLWLAEAQPGGAPVGYAVLSPPSHDLPAREDDLELKRIYVLHRFHGQAVGPRLMETVVAAARAAGARRLMLSLYEDNRRAMAFYLRQGFALAGGRKFRVGAKVYDDPVLARPL